MTCLTRSFRAIESLLDKAFLGNKAYSFIKRPFPLWLMSYPDVAYPNSLCCVSRAVALRSQRSAGLGVGLMLSRSALLVCTSYTLWLSGICCISLLLLIVFHLQSVTGHQEIFELGQRPVAHLSGLLIILLRLV